MAKSTARADESTATQITPKQLAVLLSYTIPAKLPLLIQGAPGIGKSDIISQAAHAAGARMIISHPVVSDPTDFKGMPALTTNPTTLQQEAHFLPFGDLNELINATTPTVFFLDDIGQAPPAVQAACMQLLLARRINGHKVSDHVCFIAATNRRKDRAGVAGLLEPVKSRFVSILELVTSTEDWSTWALNPSAKLDLLEMKYTPAQVEKINTNIPIELISFIRFRPALLQDFTPSNDLVNSPSPRTVVHVAKLLNLHLPIDLEYPAVSGAAGEGFASEFLAFLKIFRHLPSPDAILLNPSTHAVPDDPATLYALTGALSKKASITNFDAVTTYATRMPPEFSVCLIKDAIRLTPDLTQTKAFITWASKNASMLI